MSEVRTHYPMVLPNLMKPNVCDPDVVVVVDGDAVGHVEQVLANPGHRLRKHITI